MIRRRQPDEIDRSAGERRDLAAHVARRDEGDLRRSDPGLFEEREETRVRARPQAADRRPFTLHVFERFDLRAEKYEIGKNVFRGGENDGVAALGFYGHRRGSLDEQDLDFAAQQTRRDDGPAGDVNALALRYAVFLEEILLARHPKSRVAGRIDRAVSEVEFFLAVSGRRRAREAEQKHGQPEENFRHCPSRSRLTWSGCFVAATLTLNHPVPKCRRGVLFECVKTPPPEIFPCKPNPARSRSAPRARQFFQRLRLEPALWPIAARGRGQIFLVRPALNRVQCPGLTISCA